MGRVATQLRGLCTPRQDWRARLEGLELQRGILLALEGEAFVAHQSARLDPFPLGDFPAYGTGYLRGELRDYAYRLGRVLDDLAEEDVRTFDPTAFFERAYASLPRWRFLARIMLPNLFDTWPRSARRELETELAGLVLERRAALAALSAGVPLPAARRERESRRVPGLNWSVETDAGGVSFRLDGDLAHRAEDAPPLRFRIDRGDCPATM